MLYEYKQGYETAQSTKDCEMWKRSWSKYISVIVQEISLGLDESWGLSKIQ